MLQRVGAHIGVSPKNICIFFVFQPKLADGSESLVPERIYLEPFLYLSSSR